MSDVVVTGIGCLGPFGIGLPALAAALQAGVPLAHPVDTSGGYHRARGARLAASCHGLDLGAWLPASARRMSDLSQFAVAAARLAVHDAGLPGAGGDGTAVVLGTTFGPGGFTEQLARQILTKGGKAASPFLFTDCVANAAAGQVAIDLGARGPNLTLCQREASALLALADAAQELARGRAQLALCGAVDEMKGLSHAMLDRFRALARPSEPGGELPRPYDRRRCGVLAGEGAQVLVLETAAAARARGARVLARVAGWARGFDPTAGRASFGRDPAALAELLQHRLGGALGTVDAVVGSGSGSRHGDALDAAVLRLALPHRPPVVAPKAVHGEYGGGTLAAALLCLQGASFARPPACDQPDPALGVILHEGPLRAHRVLLSAVAAGGAAAWLLLESP